MKDIQQQIELIINDFETRLEEIGVNKTSGAMLLQLQYGGNCYIKHLGNLNNLMIGKKITGIERGNQDQNDFYSFVEKEISIIYVAESTKKNHRDTLRLLRRFKECLFFSQINYELLISFDMYMVNEGYATNTIGRHMKVFKQYINRAILLEHISVNPFCKYKIRSADTERESLSEKELLLLEQFREQSVIRNEILEAFLFSCYSGLRYSDMRRLTKQHVVSINRKRWIVIRMKKTDTDIRIPIYLMFEGRGLKLVREIKRSRGIVFKLPDSQTVNRELKKICKKTGIKKHITFHSARHTCATLLLYKGVNITTVQKILGHKSVKTTQVYSAVTDLTIEKEIKKSNTRTRSIKK